MKAGAKDQESGGSFSDQVKRVLQHLGRAKPAQVSLELGFGASNPQGKLAVRQTLRDLKKSGWAIRDAQGRYRLADDPTLRGKVQDKLWEFICLRFTAARPWNCRDAAKAAMCTLDYAKRYVDFLKDEGWVDLVGKKGAARFFRVAPGREEEKPPHWNRRAEKRKRCAGETPAPPEDRPSLAQRVNGLLEEQCVVRGRTGCEGYPQDCEDCDLQKALDCLCPGDPAVCAARLEDAQAGKPVPPDLARAGEILEEMEQAVAALGESEMVGGYFQDLRRALGLLPHPGPLPAEEREEES